MRRFIVALLFSASPLFAQPKTLLSFEKGEVTPSLASAIEKAGHGSYKLRIPSKPGIPTPDRIKTQLDKGLVAFPGIKITSHSDSITITFQGPDTPLLQALSQIEILP